MSLRNFLRSILASFSKKEGAAGPHRDLALAVHALLTREATAVTGGEMFALPDDFSRRFEVMVLFVSLLLHRLRQQGADPDLSQAVWEMTFEGFEQSLRERGVPDLRIGGRMRKLFSHAMGRRNAYLDALLKQEEALLFQAIARNVLDGAPPGDPRAPFLREKAEAAVSQVQSQFPSVFRQTGV